MTEQDVLATAVDVKPAFVVAIGASAGGLEALERLFALLPVDTGASFVVIQHLAPEHRSMMDTLLARHTTMPVRIIEDGDRLTADHVHLIPPGVMLHLEGAQLRLTPKTPRAFQLPIDRFFQSLASEFGARAVGVVLSGTGSDGTRGAGAINEAGGFLLAQDPTNARFDGMPRSVIASGLVDAVLPIEALAERLIAHLRAQPVSLLARAPADDPVDARDLTLLAILRMLSHTGGIDFEAYKPATVTRRIERRMAVRQCQTMEAYLLLVNRDPQELATLRREMLIPVTRFLRDPDTWALLAETVIEPLIRDRAPHRGLRVWIAGVSTGEEAYTMALLFLEAFERLGRAPDLKIFATDVEQANLDVASVGAYPESVAAELSPERLERYFELRHGQYVARNELRRCIVFARHNLLADPPFTRMDLVSCRNTLIYFRAAAQQGALRRLQYALVPGGYLLLGPSESLGELQADFQPVSAHHKLFRLLAVPARLLDLRRSSVAGVAERQRPALAGVSARAPALLATPRDEGFQSLLKAYAPPPALLVNRHQELVHVYGDLAAYLQVPEGQASLDLRRLLSAELVPVAMTLVLKVLRDAQPIHSDPLLSLRSGAPPVRVSAWPVGASQPPEHVLLAFETVVDASAVTALLPSGEVSERVEVLEKELAATRESLHSTVEDLEASNEELQATNEELMVSNEELQSANEELQSVNEELTTINAEYQEKHEILTRTLADLDNMARAVSTGAVFVDSALRVTRFSPDAANIYKLREGDLGRPLADLTHTLDYPGLIEDLQRTLASGQLHEHYATGPGDSRYLVRMLPYQVPSSHGTGAVITFMDVTAVHHAGRLQQILDALIEHLAVLDSEGTIVAVNAAWRRFAIENGDPELLRSGPGASYLHACRTAQGEDADVACAAAAGLREVLGGARSHFALEYPCHSPTQKRWFLMHVSALAGDARGAVVSHIDITRWYAETRA